MHCPQSGYFSTETEHTKNIPRDTSGERRSRVWRNNPSLTQIYLIDGGQLSENRQQSINFGGKQQGRASSF